MSFADARLASRETGSLAWVSLVEPDVNDFDVISGSLGLDPHLLEEAAKFPHRSGVEKHESRLVAVLPILPDSGEGNGTVGTGKSRSIESDWILVVAAEEPNMIVTLTDGETSY